MRRYYSNVISFFSLHVKKAVKTLKNTGLDKNLIESMYYDKHMSLREISNELDFSASQVGRMLKKYDHERYQLEKEARNYGKEQQDPRVLASKFIELFKANMSMKSIAEKYGYTPVWVSKIINEYESEALAEERAKRKEIRANRFKKTMADAAIEATMKDQHRAATSELSYKSQMPGSLMWRICPSLYKTTSSGFKRRTENEMGCAIPNGMPKYIKSAIQYVQDNIGGKRNRVSGKMKRMLTTNAIA